MTPTRNGIIVKVFLGQKDTIEVGGMIFMKVPRFNVNYRDKTPVVAVIVQGNEQLSAGTMIITHHNYFQGESAFSLGDDLYAIPVSENIFATVDESGDLHPIFGNLIVERIAKEDGLLSTPESLKKNYKDRVVIARDGEGYKKGQQVFTKPMADYEIVYNWGGVEKRVIKIKASDIVAFLK